MRMIVVGLGVQGKKRLAVADKDVVATVDPINQNANYTNIKQLPLENFDGAFICTPDQAKLELLEYLLAHGKHILVEKPLLAEDNVPINRLVEIAQSTGAVCYTAYNHRFEPHIIHLKNLLDSGELGTIYLGKFFYGNGTASDVKLSTWRDQGAGVLPDLGSHLLDMILFLFGRFSIQFQPWSFNRFENCAFDHFLFGSVGQPALQVEATLLSWRNTFTIDIFGERGSAHIHGLCKWGPSTFTVRKRVFPSGKPDQEAQIIERSDPTWAAEYEYFKQLCQTGGTNLANDLWINSTLNGLTQQWAKELL